MTKKNYEVNYDKSPLIEVKGHPSFSGYDEIVNEIKRNNSRVIVVDCYPGVDKDEVLRELSNKIKPDIVIDSDYIFYDSEKLNEMMKPFLTNDRVRGVMYYGNVRDFVNISKLEEQQKQLETLTDKTVLIYGCGASLITEGDLLIYADLTRWEIQLRYRDGMPNFKQENYNEDLLKKYKRGYFVEWRIFDKHKRSLFNKADYWLDTNISNKPIMISGDTFNKAMTHTTKRPFRIVPYFDPGVWGGQWMKDKFNLNPKEDNYAWSFDGVPEENSLNFEVGENIIQFPAMNLTLSRPQEFLGERVYSRFGAEFPIRFDLLDTMGGQNLSLQVHPTMDFVKSNYGMPFTQEESYYLLDAEPDAKVYLGVRNDIDKESFEEDLEKAAKGEIVFPAEKHINIINTKKHDHLLIPPGLVHCSAKGCMVLEISSSAYIFTFKLWDWERLGLDGLPRPIHIEEGKQVINYKYNKDFADRELINVFEKISEEDGVYSEKTGLHRTEYIETHRHTFSKPIILETDGNVRMLNLVGGVEIEVTSPTNKFETFVVNYAETFIIPASVDEFKMAPTDKNPNNEVKVLEAFVKC